MPTPPIHVHVPVFSTAEYGRRCGFERLHVQMYIYTTLHVHVFNHNCISPKHKPKTQTNMPLQK